MCWLTHVTLMMIHRCLDNGWRNGRLALVHANEGKCKECGAVYHCDDRPGDHCEVNLRDRHCLSSGVNTSKGHMEDKYTLKGNICKQDPPPNQGSYSNSHKYVYMCRFAHLSYKLCKYTLTHVSTCWHPSTVACEVL